MLVKLTVVGVVPLLLTTVSVVSGVWSMPCTWVHCFMDSVRLEGLTVSWSWRTGTDRPS